MAELRSLLAAALHKRTQTLCSPFLMQKLASVASNPITRPSVALASILSASGCVIPGVILQQHERPDQIEASDDYEQGLMIGITTDYSGKLAGLPFCK